VFFRSNIFCFRRLVLIFVVLCFSQTNIIRSQATPRDEGGRVSEQAMSTSDQNALEGALKDEDSKRSEHAELTLRELVKRHPENFEVVEALGLLYADMERFSDAEPYLERAPKLSPSSAVAYSNLGAVYLKLNKNEEAVKALSRAAALDEKNPQTETNLGLAFMQTNQPALAAIAFERAARSAPQDPDLLCNWSVALLNSGHSDKANEVLSRIPNHDSSAQVEGLMGDIAEQQSNYKAAVEHYQTAANLDPSEANLYSLGLEFLRHWTFEPAIKIFEYGISRYPKSAHLLSGLGIAKYANNDFAGAVPIFAQLLGGDPDNAFYADILGHSCSLMPDSIEGCSSLVDFAERHPLNATAATYAAASILHRPAGKDNLLLARKLLDQAIVANPNLAEAYYQLGILDQQEARWQDSIGVLQKSLALKPTFSKAHYRIALAYSHSGQREKAQEEIALQQRFSQQEKDELNAKFKEVTTFLVTGH
jgi:tetratricopeptide (TPR) repeat protein